MAEPVDPDPGHWRELDAPRIPPLNVEELNAATTRQVAPGAELRAAGPPTPYQ